MESQRVKSLKEGYLRGWLSFNYQNLGSRLREELILDHIEEQHLIDLLRDRLMIETVLRTTLSKKDKITLKPIFDTVNSIIGLKLPLAKPKDKINKLRNLEDPQQLKEEMAEWKEFFKQLEKDKAKDKPKENLTSDG